jgi:hypothetical protein
MFGGQSYANIPSKTSLYKEKAPQFLERLFEYLI